MAGQIDFNLDYCTTCQRILGYGWNQDEMVNIACTILSSPKFTIIHQTFPNQPTIQLERLIELMQSASKDILRQGASANFSYNKETKEVTLAGKVSPMRYHICQGYNNIEPEVNPDSTDEVDLAVDSSKKTQETAQSILSKDLDAAPKTEK